MPTPSSRMPLSSLSASEVVARLDLAPHPEGGFYRETWRDQPADDTKRGHGTAIYFLLPGGVENRWHRVDAVEIWHHYAGAPLELRLGHHQPVADETLLLGPDLAARQRPQRIVPVDAWQSARSLGDWTLVGCTVCPAFQFEGFQMLEPPTDVS